MKKVLTILSSLIISTFLALPVAFAESAASIPDTAKIDSGDTAFVLMCAAMVMIMTPALGLFYGGMVRTKNVLNTIMQSFFILGLVSVQWVSWGYSVSFSGDINGIIGNFSWAFLKGVGQLANADYAATIPHFAFMIFQGMFAIIATALITGAFAERMKFSAFAVFSLVWVTLVYDPVAHWVWGNGGWMKELGILDFAGGTVVHILSGVSGLIVAIYIGKRKGYGSDIMLPHHLPMTVIGTALLWFGWFGFNAGSALGANGLAASAFVTTHTSAAAATVGWVLLEWLYHGKPTMLGAASGAVAGLVGITPAAGYVNAISAIIIGMSTAAICFLAVSIIKTKLGYDDSLDAFGIHGIGGAWGAILTGVFASTAINPAGADGLLYGNPAQLKLQIIGVIVSCIFAAIMTLAILKVLSLFIKLRADENEEVQGLDISEHGERGYTHQDLVAGSPLFNIINTAPEPTLVHQTMKYNN